MQGVRKNQESRRQDWRMSGMSRLEDGGFEKMINLKTLNDLQQSHYFRDETGKILLETDWKISKNDLRREAIRWIKELKQLEGSVDFEWRKTDHPEFIHAFFTVDTTSAYQVKCWIKHFFNITEEDLRQ